VDLGVLVARANTIHARAALANVRSSVYDGAMSTRDPDEPDEDPPDEAAASVPDTSPPGTSAAQPHDALFRQIFGDPAQAAAVLRSILPPRVAAHIDWDTPFEPTRASMVGKGAQQRHGDLVFKVKLIDGRGAFVWVLFEHQSTVQRWMALRLSGMVQHFLDDWHRRTPGATHLPAVLPVVLHHGPRPWRAPTSLLELTDLSEQARADLAAHLLSLDFVLDDLRTVPDEAIDARPLGPLARLVLGVMKHGSSPEFLAFYLAHAADVRDLLASEHGRLGLYISISYTERVHPELDRDTLIRHLTPLVGPGLEHTMLTFEQLLRNEAFEKGLDKGREQGREDGIKEGVEKGQREFLLDLLTERFGSLSPAVTQRLAQASLQELKRWGCRILNAASLDDVFASS
jgi:predicted transposase YdaD